MPGARDSYPALYPVQLRFSLTGWMVTRHRGREQSPVEPKGSNMYIGVGAIVVILVVVILFMMLRRR
jgi:uncharacterized membrane protein YidH (DUF202 family)